MSLHSALLVLTSIAVGCASAPMIGPAATSPADLGTSASPDGAMPIGHAVVPSRYDLSLSIDPSKPRFSGEVRIAATMAAASRTILMHGQGLTIQTATAILEGERRVPLVATEGRGGALLLEAPDPLPAGALTLEISWDAPLEETTEGLYRVAVGERWYAYTQFEPLEARRAFPCFDQPDLKAVFSTTIEVPRGMTALTNGPQKAVNHVAEQSVFSFAPTRPLPTYLVAFAVGEFDIVEAPADAMSIPFRIITTKGKGHLAAYALERTPLIMDWMTDYFGRPYPFQKLDMIAVPNFAAGAMENAGLVTYRERLLLLDGATAPVRSRLWSQGVIAHELGHMWFGNLVTMTWWNDLWLNEAFATWIAARCVSDVDPELEMELEVLGHRAWAMGLDAKAHARAIRQPIRSAGDIYNAFDGITYTKGAAVLAMIESWLGRDTFARGVRAYIDARPFGNATTEDLLAALGDASGEPVDQVMAHFLTQPGTPLVSVDVTCHPSSAQPATLTLSQTRYRALDSSAPLGQPWRFPVCVRYGIGTTTQRECFVLDAPTARRELAERGCPDWLVANDEERGYYRWRLPEHYLAALTGTHHNRLTLRERVALPGHLSALLSAGAIDVGSYVDALQGVAAERSTHRAILEEVADGLRGLDRIGVTPKNEPAFARLVTETVGHHADGLAIHSDAPVRQRRVRPLIIALLGHLAESDELRRYARAVADASLDEVGGVGAAADVPVNPDQMNLYLPLAAAMSAGVTWKKAYWSRLVASLPAASDPGTRAAIVKALASFTEPQLVTQSLQLVLQGKLLSQDYGTLRRGLSKKAAVVNVAWDWMTGNFDAIVARLGVKSAPYLPRMGTAFCDDASAEKVERFFDEKRAHIPSGLDRNLSLVLESIRDCATQRSVHRDALNALLEAR